MIKTKAFPLGPVLLPIGEGSPLLAIFVACSIISVVILYLFQIPRFTFIGLHV